MFRTFAMPAVALTVVFTFAGCAASSDGSGTMRDNPSQALSDQTQAFRATGNEPGWRLEIIDQTIILLTAYGQTRLETPVPAPETTIDFMRYVARTRDTDLTVTIYDRLCTDTMSGMPYPNTVDVIVDGSTLNGCGGDPATLLQGAEWVIEDLNGGGVIEGSRITLKFGTDGLVSGRASCNQYSGEYSLTGESLTVMQPVATQMACAPSLMRQEDRFFGLLTSIQRFTLSPDGTLVLHTGDELTMTAGRE